MLVILTMLVCYLQCCEGKAKIKTTEQKIEWLTTYDTAPIKKFVRDVKNRDELAEVFEYASQIYDVDINYLIVIGLFETVYRNLVGDGGRSFGEMQVGVMGRRECNCEMESLIGRISCGACWLAMGKQWCGNLDGGLQAYISGTCNPRNMRSRRAFIIRKRLIKTLEKFE